MFERLPEGLTDADVLLDMTGGPKAATTGIVLAGLPLGRRLQLVLPESKDEHGFAKAAGEVVEVAINYRLKKVRAG